MEETKTCPNCGQEIPVIDNRCRYCDFWINKAGSLRHEEDEVLVNHVLSPFRTPVPTIAFAMAIVAQVCFLLGNSVIVSYLPFSGNTAICTGHVLKTLGEGFLLACLTWGMRTQKYPMQKLLITTIVFFAIYHLAAVGIRFRGFGFITYWTMYALYLLSSVLYLSVGFLLAERYRGKLSDTGGLLMACVIYNLVLNIGFALVGRSIIVDAVYFLLASTYLFYLRRLLQYVE